MCINLYPHYYLYDEIDDYISKMDISNIKENEFEEYYNKLSNYISKYNEYIWNYTIERDKIVEQIDEVMKKYNEEICHNIIPTDLKIILQSQEMISKRSTRYTIEEYTNHYNDLKQCIDQLNDYYVNYKSNMEILKDKMYLIYYYYYFIYQS